MFPTPSRPDPRRVTAGLVLALLAACGGGDDSRAERPADPKCAERPEVCR